MSDRSQQVQRPAFPAGCALAAAVCLLASPAWAYIDPGTGSYLIQVIMAVFLGSLFVLKSFWKKTVRKIARILPKRPAEDPPKRGL